MKFILMDIEGTTTDISYVHEILFPYSREHLPKYLVEHANDPQVQEAIKLVQTTVFQETGKTVFDENCIDVLLQWIEDDRKHPALKTLQGLVWKEGFESGLLRGHIYPEVKERLESWKQQGIVLGIYSSGSVQAQKLLYSHSVEGDLTPLLSAFFDTKVGPKLEASSYQNIVDQLGIAADEILFLSDVKEELDAAREVGLNTVQLVREWPPMLESGHVQVKDFDQISL